MKYLAYGYLITMIALQTMLNVITVEALSNSIVVYQVQTTGATSGTSTEEIIVLYNNSVSPIDVTNWCVSYTSLNDNVGFRTCIEPPDARTSLWLEPHTMLTFATSNFLGTHEGFVSDFTINSGMSSVSGHVVLSDNNGAEIDRVGWGAASNPEGIAAKAHRAGTTLSRPLLAELLIDTDDNQADFSEQLLIETVTRGLYEENIPIDVCPNISGMQEVVPADMLQDTLGDCVIDICVTIDGLQIVMPDGYFLDNGVCVNIAKENATLFITELLPNALGVDTGQEFIELYNPNMRTVDLAGYQLLTGPTFAKGHLFESGKIEPGAYLFYSDAETDITLPNSNGMQLRLVAPSGDIVSESALYSNADDDESWALIEDQWVYTNQITPGEENKQYLQPSTDEVLGITTVLAPCASGKYRNPDTNRCKTAATAQPILLPCGKDEFRNPVTNRCKTAVSSQTILLPCDKDKYRNPDTNRCRKHSTTTSLLVPCRAGQERNPDTKRCRSVNSSSSLAECREGKERNPNTNRCRTVSSIKKSQLANTVSDVPAPSSGGIGSSPLLFGAVGGSGGYMLYEWRRELRKLIGRLKR